MPQNESEEGEVASLSAASAHTHSPTSFSSTTTTAVSTCDPRIAIVFIYISRWLQHQEQQSTSYTDDINNNHISCLTTTGRKKHIGRAATVEWIPNLSVDCGCDEEEEVVIPSSILSLPPTTTTPVPTLTSTPLSAETNSNNTSSSSSSPIADTKEDNNDDDDRRIDIFNTCLAQHTNHFCFSLSNDESDDDDEDVIEVPDLEALHAPVHSSLTHSSNNNTTTKMMGNDDPRLRLLEFQTDIELLDRNTTSGPSSSLSSPAQRQQQQQMVLVQQILDTVGQFIDTADQELQQLEESTISMGLLRACQQLADSVGHLAEQIEHHPEKRQLARACLQDFQQQNNHDSLRLFSTNTTTIPTSSSKEDDESDWIHNENTANITGPEEDEMIQAMGVAAELLRDVEAALRAISQEEADEIAQVGLIVAHLFVASLQHMHSQIHTTQLPKSNNTRYQESPNMELVEEEEETTREHSSSTPKNWKQTNRIRCLWPPIGPEVAKALRWSKDELDKQHWLLTVALGITLWPVAVMGTLVGTPAIITDHCIQTLYQHFQNGPILTAAEMAAAQLYQTSRLCWITGKAMARPTLRVATRQLQRHGPDIQEWIIHRITHPVQTIGETASGIACMSGQVIHAVQGFLAQREEERNRVQEMQI
jgi:hypothetical protein